MTNESCKWHLCRVFAPFVDLLSCLKLFPPLFVSTGGWLAPLDSHHLSSSLYPIIPLFPLSSLYLFRMFHSLSRSFPPQRTLFNVNQASAALSSLYASLCKQTTRRGLGRDTSPSHEMTDGAKSKHVNVFWRIIFSLTADKTRAGYCRLWMLQTHRVKTTISTPGTWSDSLLLFFVFEK